MKPNEACVRKESVLKADTPRLRFLSTVCFRTQESRLCCWQRLDFRRSCPSPSLPRVEDMLTGSTPPTLSASRGNKLDTELLSFIVLVLESSTLLVEHKFYELLKVLRPRDLYNVKCSTRRGFLSVSLIIKKLFQINKVGWRRITD